MSKADFSAQGDEHLQKGQFVQAEQSYRLALKQDKNAGNWIKLGRTLFFQGKTDDAENAFAEALEIDEKNPEALLGMAGAMSGQKKDLLAIGYLALAARAAPDNPVYKQAFLDMGGRTTFLQYNAEAADILLLCLRTPELTFLNAQILWHTLLLSYEPFRKIHDEKNLLKTRFDPAPILAPIFIEGLKKLLLSGLKFEEFVCRLRQWLLLGLDAPENTLPEKDYGLLADALAVYCIKTDYIIRETEEEKIKITAIEKQFKDDGNMTLPLLSIYACYRPLTNLTTDNKKIPLPREGGGIAAMLKENEKLKLLRTSIAQSAGITDDVSLKVQEQYEEFPYPRWDRVPVTTKERLPAALNTVHHQLLGKPLKILIAGGGTGWEPLLNATRFPKADITAIDLSRTSLSYAKMKAEEHGIKNVTFMHMDILTLADSTESYDLIASSGVLHHMKEPLTGWKILCDRLKAGGIMKIGLYSKTARRSIDKARKAIASQKIGHDRNSMLSFRENISEHLDKESVTALQKTFDYYTLSTFRDLIFHTHEYCFELPEIEEALQHMGMSLLGIEVLPEVTREYKKEYPGDPQALSLKNWHAFEQKHPDTFMGMYQFWCQKK